MTLDIAVSRLVGHVTHWTPVRWSKPVANGSGSRAETVYALVQQIADAAADAEGQPRRVVPRLTNDLALVDQLRVVSSDLLTAGAARPDLLNQATEAVRATNQAL